MSGGDRIALRPLETGDLTVVAPWLEAEGLGVPAATSHNVWGRRVSTDPRIVCRVACLGLELAGFFRLDLGPDATAELSLAVAPALRRRGIGRRLLDLAIAEARQRALHRLVAAIRRDNGGALAFFRAAGLEETGRQVPGFVLLQCPVGRSHAAPAAWGLA
jgi:ribosomal protein S18 acetylase RimI-like enzyme